MIVRFTVSALLVVMVLIGSNCSPTPQSAKSVPLGLSSRRVLKVCAERNQLTRADLVALAQRYSVMSGNEPSIVEILKLNEKCRPAPDAEQLDLTRPQCASENVDQCRTGIVLVPIR